MISFRLRALQILLHHNRLGVTEELHIIKFVTELQHAGLQCIIEVSTLQMSVEEEEGLLELQVFSQVIY